MIFTVGPFPGVRWVYSHLVLEEASYPFLSPLVSLLNPQLLSLRLPIAVAGTVTVLLVQIFFLFLF